MERTYTASEFWDFTRLTENQNRFFELIDGKIIEVSPSNPRSSFIASRIIYKLMAFVDPRDLGYITGEQGGYEVSDEDTLAPDVAFISKERQPELPETGFNKIPPDLVVEVVSPSDAKKDIEIKLQKYQDARVSLIWYVYPDREIVEVYALDKDKQEVGKDGVLNGGDVLPGFKLAVADIFKK